MPRSIADRCLVEGWYTLDLINGPYSPGRREVRTEVEEWQSMTRRRGTRRDPSRRAQVLLVEDHPLVREGLTRVIDQEPDLAVSGTAVNAQQAIDAIAASRPDIAVVDVIDLVKELRVRYPDMPVIMLSLHDDVFYAERALRAGAKGCVMKREPPRQLVHAIRKVLAGGLCFSEAVTDRLLRRATSHRNREFQLPMERLSDRELEVLEFIGQGRTVRSIAEQLHLSVKTVQAHRAHLKEKLSLDDTTTLLRFAIHWVESERDA
jgi:DNA-binding NarL/FixJ family response regulator